MAKWTYKKQNCLKVHVTFTFAYESGSRHIEGDTVGGKAMYSCNCVVEVVWLFEYNIYSQHKLELCRD